MKKIFIFDAYASIRRLLAEDLAAEGNLIMAISKPEFVRETVDTFHPDLVILDIYMQGGMRWDLLEEIKTRHPSLPVLIFSAVHPQEVPRLRKADAWVRKSFIFEELKQKIKEMTEETPMGARGEEFAAAEDPNPWEGKGPSQAGGSVTLH